MIDRPQHLRNGFLLVVLLLAGAVAPVSSGTGPSAGFIEEWSAVGEAGWEGGSTSHNPGTGGLLGTGDGYLLISTIPSGGKLGAQSSGAAYVGDWLAAGIRSVKVWLNDVNDDENLEIHFSLGIDHSNFWQYNEGFDPPHQSWAQFVVDLTDSTKFTRIFDGPGFFLQALQGVTRVHFRHDLPPFSPPGIPPVPEDIIADVGVDHLELSDEVVPAAPLTWGRLKLLYR